MRSSGIDCKKVHPLPCLMCITLYGGHEAVAALES